MNPSELTPLFNIRVYALVVKNNRLLISEEQHGGFFLRKFPGGGLQFGEGVLQALHRELKEELDADVDSASLLCVTEDFVVSFLNNKQQVIGVHYLVDLKQDYSDDFLKNNHLELENGHIQFKWVLIDSLTAEDFTSTVDKSAFEKLKQYLLERR
jgi:8-oxo-dGTP pyrophosphatase MutT (NUDIX family)